MIFTLCSFSLLSSAQETSDGTFESDVTFLKQHKSTIVLKSPDGHQQIAIIPDYQGRVMTSTSKGPEGKSYGWINYDLIASSEIKDHMNAFGGEDRFWLGPEGGQYSIFFESGKDFTTENWQTPPSIDSESFEVIEQSESHALFKKSMLLTNYHGFDFDIEVSRKVNLLSKSEIESDLNLTLPDGISYVGYQSENKVTNTGDEDWNMESGLLSIWILGMFNPSEQTTVIVPYKGEAHINSDYFGEIGPDRLKVENGIVQFKGDGKYRSKIGVPSENATPYLGSYDPVNQILTIVKFSFEGDQNYVNSLWEIQDNPYGGDVANAYNDGPMDNGDIMGPFYELESSSPAKALNMGESLLHIHSTYHFEGNEAFLNDLSKALLMTDLTKLKF